MDDNTRGLDFDAVSLKTRPPGNNYLFCIGIDKYEHWPVLKSAVKDAREISRILTKYYQFEESHVTALYDDQATRDAVFAKLRSFTETLTEGDNLIIYYSGHGYYDKQVEITYWIPVEAKLEPDHAIDWINTETVISYLKPIRSFHIFLLVDSCFSGTLFQYRAASPKGEDHKSRTALASGREEVVMDSLEGGHSPFAQGIITVLESAADKYIRASQLANEVKRFLENKQVPQTPVDGRILARPYDENGDFVFHLKISEEESWARAVEKETAEGYKVFMESFPKSKHLAEATETYKWLTASEENSIAGFQAYLNAYPKGKYFSLALSQLTLLEEELLWNDALTKDTLSAYFHYLHKFPEGKYIEKARVKTGQMHEDEDDQAWKEALRVNSEQAYRQYLELAGSKKYSEQAQDRLNQVSSAAKKNLSTEELQWKQAQEKNTYLSLLDFTQAFPDSSYVDRAREEMKLKDNIAYNKIKMVESSASLTLKEKIVRCLKYFEDYPGASNNEYVKKIKDRLQIQEIRSRQIR